MRRYLILPAALLTAALLLSSCARAERFGFRELERRLCETDKKYAFDTETTFRREGVYHVFYQEDGQSLLLKAAEDENCRLTFVSLTAIAADGGTAERFSALACALSDVFLPQEARADARASLQLADPGTFFRNETLTAEYGRYGAVFFKTEEGISLMLRYG